AASVRPEPGSNSPIKFVTGSKLANHFMIDSLTLSLFSFQRAFSLALQKYQTHNIPRIVVWNQQVIIGVFQLVAFVSLFLRGGLLI
ncbi:hypothetical protein, partial [Brevibacillus formosus]|uniref:hypothetical protein n=1 Tax=Brevibacillus formosus TaxID=54913 RepID=UPI003F196BE4